MLTLPIFPLPGLVLFPRTMMPLHIFEPRYCQLIGDVLARDGRLVVGQLRPGWQRSGFQDPQIHRIVTQARILHHETLGGGRFNIMVEGVDRVEIARENPGNPYRMVDCEPLTDHPEIDLHQNAPTLVQELSDAVDLLRPWLPQVTRQLRNLKETHLHPGIIADVVAAALVNDAYARQSILEELIVSRRLRLVIIQVLRMAVQYEARASRSKTTEPGSRDEAGELT